MKTKLSERQKEVIEYLKKGANINYFHGIGTRYTPSACLEDMEGKRIKSISVATCRHLRDKGLIEQSSKEGYHSTFKLKTNT